MIGVAANVAQFVQSHKDHRTVMNALTKHGKNKVLEVAYMDYRLTRIEAFVALLATASFDNEDGG